MVPRRLSPSWLAVVGALAAVASATAGMWTPPVSPALYSGLAWRCIGPFDGGPVTSVVGQAGEPGVYVIATPGGGSWKTIDGGDTWTPIGDGPFVTPLDGQALRSWTDPANPRRMARVEDRGIAVSLDGGATWTAKHDLPIAQVARLDSHPSASLSIADPARPGLMFKGHTDGVSVSFDRGATWQSLQLNMPKVAINDLDIRGNNLVAATQGRSVWQLDDISPLRQLVSAAVSAPAILFQPANAILPGPAGADSAPVAVNIDYYVTEPNGEVRLEVLDASGRVVHSATNATADSRDLWLAVVRPLPTSAGHHRVGWNLRLDPPPAQHHRYAHFAPALFQDMPSDPEGPFVLPGNYRVRLTAAGRSYIQPLVVRNDPRVGDAPAALASQRREFELAMKMYGAMQVAHREFVQLSRVRAQLKPMLTSADADLAAVAATLDARLAELDGSDWTGLVIPDADDEPMEDEAKEGKHPDFVPPKPVSVSKDYDDPTSILGRKFGNVDHAPAFATVSAAIGPMLKKATGTWETPGSAAIADYTRSCQQLSGVLDAWRTINAQDLPAVNAELAKRHLPALPVAASVSTIACGPGMP